LGHPLITKLDGLIDEIKNNFYNQRQQVPGSLQKILDYHLNTVVESCEKFMENSNNAAGEWLHNVNHVRPDVSGLKKVIDAFPNALLHVNDKGEIPIQTNSRQSYGAKYIPILAEEASKREIGPERGGLLLPSLLMPGKNILQFSVTSKSRTSASVHKKIERRCRCAIKALREAKLLIDGDFARFNLLGLASTKLTRNRLEYLINVYPASLSILLPNGDYSIHISNYVSNEKEDQIQAFTIFLKYGMKYYPEKFGFLFRRNRNGGRPIKQAIAIFGKKETLSIIQKELPPSEDHPILHSVYRYAPSLAGDFVYRYPNAVHLKDRQGRHLLYIAIRRGLKLSPSLLMMIHCDKQCLEEKDPVTNLYPFMLAATSGYPKDLTTIYNLLSYRPEVMSRCLGDEDT